MDSVLAVVADPDPDPEQSRLLRGLRDAIDRVVVVGRERLEAGMEARRGELPGRAAVFLRLPTIAALGVVEAAARIGFRRLVVVSEYGSVAAAVQVMRRGADDYLCAPRGLPDLLAALDDPPAAPRPAGSAWRPETGAARAPAAPSLDRAIWEYIHFVLAGAGTLAEAARRLGVDRRSLRRMLAQYPAAV